MAVRASRHAAFIYLAFPNDPTLANLSSLYEAELRRRGIRADRLNPAHFHCSLVYLDSAEDDQLDHVWDHLGLPLTFRTELVAPIHMGEALAISIAPDPALIRLQSDLYRLALENGCTTDARDFSNPSNFKPHVSLLMDLPTDADISGLDELAPGVLPFRIGASSVVVSRDEYDSVRTVRLPAMAGDRAYIERGGPHIWPGRRVVERRSVERSDVIALLRGEVRFVPGSRQPILLGDPLAVRGGPGSGNFAHAGRPGEVGGSAAGGGSQRTGATRESEESYPVLPFTKKAIADVLRWSTSRYNEYSKADAVEIAHKILKEGTERFVMSAGAYTISSAMTGPDYLIDGPGGFIANGSGSAYQGHTEGFVEAKRWYFDVPRSVERGGPDSGNFGHAGRPGHIGGSAPGGGAATREPEGRYGSKASRVADAMISGRRHAEFTVKPGVLFDGYIAPDGRAISIRPRESGLEDTHADAAAEALKKTGLPAGQQGDPQRWLQAMRSLGFVRVTNVYNQRIALDFWTPLTRATKGTLTDYLLANRDTEVKYEANFNRGLSSWPHGGDTEELARVAGLELRGGPGSGYFAHAGRPGEVGGSAPGGGGASTRESETSYGSQGRINPALTKVIAGHTFTPADVAGVQEGLATAAVEVAPGDEGGRELWIAPDGTAFDPSKSGHEMAAQRALVDYYGKVLPEETKSRYTLEADPDYPPETPAFYVNYQSANGELRLGRIVNDGAEDSAWSWRASAWVHRNQEEFLLDDPSVKYSSTRESALEDARQFSTATVVTIGMSMNGSNTGEGLLIAHGFVRLSRGGSGRENYVGMQWDRTITPTDEQRSIMAKVARYTMELDMPEADKGVVWERMNPEGRAFGAIADSGVVMDWPNRDFTNALVGRAFLSLPLPWWAWLVFRGGQGSGYFAHPGRPGEVGGSAAGGGASTREPGEHYGLTADWNPTYLANFRKAIGDALSAKEQTYVPGQESMNGWVVAPDGRTFEVGFGNHDAAFADAIYRAGLEEEPIEGMTAAFEDAEGFAPNLADAFLDKATKVMYDAGFIAVDEDARHGSDTIILAFKGRPPETRAQRLAIKDMVLSGDVLPEFEFKTPSGGYIEGDTLWKFEQAVGITMRGGPGSGHFGHEGRPGQVGGSEPGAEAGERKGGPLGPRMSASFKVPRTGRWESVRDALAAIDAVHGGDVLQAYGLTEAQLIPIVEMRGTGGRTGHTMMVTDRDGNVFIKNVGVRLTDPGDGIPEHAELTVAHEVGHVLDYTIWGEKIPASGEWGSRVRASPGSRATWYEGTDSPVRDVMVAIRESDAYAQLKDFHSATVPWMSAPGQAERGASLVYDRQTLSYLAQPQELFARSYGQYIATRSGNETMRAQVRDFQDQTAFGHPPMQWTDTDFEPIAAAYDKLFKDKGWSQ